MLSVDAALEARGVDRRIMDLLGAKAIDLDQSPHSTVVWRNLPTIRFRLTTCRLSTFFAAGMGEYRMALSRGFCRALGLGALLLGIASAPARAQDGSEPLGARTEESAQRFLAEMLSRYEGGVVYADGAKSTYYTDYKNRPYRSGMVQGHIAYWKLAGIERIDRCKTRFHVQAGSGEVQSNDYPYDSLYKPAPIDHLDVDWSTINLPSYGLSSTWKVLVPYKGHKYLGIELPFAKSQTFGQGNWLFFGFIFNDEDQFRRLKFAVTFLTDTCIPKSSTGF